ncbi:class I SAM-dependent methyltransferase [Kribbella turkmenica]|uniref:Class I SAM-dependent methyltransferase n=2 Tax=Kribbella turkmenica TaxID=2530375 RepID=A0A4R4WD49_9ACTN|nr:class I SAM-dependent methyltransferase [Kribbella turkmenica]
MGKTGGMPAFARDARTAAYYDQRAGEYDEWYLGQGRYAELNPPWWHEEVSRLVDLVRALPPARTLDVACGTGFLTQHLRGAIVGLDQSAAMLGVAGERVPTGSVVVGDALRLPVADGAFDRVLTGHFYGHLPADERAVFLAEVRRVAAGLIVIDTALRPGVEPAQWTDRVLNDGSRHRIYKRYLTSDQLAAEIGGQILLAGRSFVAAAVTWDHHRKDG